MPWFINKPFVLGLVKAEEHQKIDRNAIRDLYYDEIELYERAIDGLKDMDNIEKIQEALYIEKIQEVTKQLEKLRELREYELAIELAAITHHQTAYEEIRKTAQDQTLQFQFRLHNEDLFLKNRFTEHMSGLQTLQEDFLQKQIVNYTKLEMERRNTIEQEIKLRNKLIQKTILDKTRSKSELLRKKTELAIMEIKTKAAEQRNTVVETVKLAGNIIGVGVNSLFTDFNRTIAIFGGISVIALGVYAAKGTTNVAVKYIESRIGKPKLVTETSRFSIIEAFKHPMLTFSKYTKIQNETNSNDALSGIILTPILEKRVRDISIATRNARMNQAVYRNFLIYGPSGTGKTLFSKKLAKNSGMDYAIMTGGDVVSMGKEAAGAIHKLFDWAHTTKNGLILFIDEADAFLKKTSSDKVSEELRAAMNAFLYRTSDQSDRYMVILAGKAPDVFDSAVNDRLDHLIEFTLPGLQEREKLTQLYFDQYILKPANAEKRLLSVEEFDYKEFLHLVALQTEGMSARALAKLGVAWQAAAFTAFNCRITHQMCIDVVNVSITDHIQKMACLSEEEKSYKINKSLLKSSHEQLNGNMEKTKHIFGKEKRDKMVDETQLNDENKDIMKRANEIITEEKKNNEEKFLALNIKDTFNKYPDTNDTSLLKDEKDNTTNGKILDKKDLGGNKKDLVGDIKDLDGDKKDLLGGKKYLVGDKKDLDSDKKDLDGDKKNLVCDKKPKND